MMTFEEARALIEHEMVEGVAYTSRFGEYPDRARVEEILEALRTVHRELKGQGVIDRKLAASLFVINDQVQGNMAGAQAKGIPISEEFSTRSFFEINELLYAIFEDWKEMDSAYPVVGFSPDTQSGYESLTTRRSMLKFRRLTAELVTEDIPRTIEYYTKTLGLELDSVYPQHSPIPQWVQFKCNNDYLMFESRKSLGQVIPEIQWVKLGGSFDIFIEMEGVVEYYESIKDKVQVIVELTDIPFKQFAIKDINGYILLFGQLD